jgi:hypothetical protein
LGEWLLGRFYLVAEMPDSARPLVLGRPGLSAEPNPPEGNRRPWFLRAAGRLAMPPPLQVVYVLFWLALVPLGIYLFTWTHYVFVLHNVYGDLPTYHIAIYEYHAHLTATHPYGSKWYSWPFLVRPVWYYYDGSSFAPRVAGIFDLGNPVIWWASVPSLIFLIFQAIRGRDATAAFILLAFCAAYLPYVLVSRVLFLYHMFGGLPFMILAVSYWMAKLWPARIRLQLGRRSLALEGADLTVAYATLAVLAFMFFWPLWSGFAIPSWFFYAHIWFPSWI